MTNTTSPALGQILYEIYSAHMIATYPPPSGPPYPQPTWEKLPPRSQGIWIRTAEDLARDCLATSTKYLTPP